MRDDLGLGPPGVYGRVLELSNELVGDELTLSELGIQGAAKDAQDEEVYEIYYDFKPDDTNNSPLLLVTPRSHVDA